MRTPLERNQFSEQQLCNLNEMKLLSIVLFCFLLVGLTYSMSVEKHDHAALGFNHDERNPACRGRGPPPTRGSGNGGSGSSQTNGQGSGTNATANGNS